MDQLKEWWNRVVRDYFTFSAGERNGVVVLVLLIILISILPQISKILTKEDKTDFSQFKNEVDSFVVAQENVSKNDSDLDTPSFSEIERSNTVPVISTKEELFAFDPNFASESEMLKLGISKNVVNTIIKYRAKGGVFKAKDDLKKIYGMNQEEYLKLEPFIQIESTTKQIGGSNFDAKFQASSIEKSNLLEINSADSTQLINLPMIGPTLSTRILKFRNKLGGFYSIDQLKEVYGLSVETFDLVKSKIYVDSVLIKKINLNSVTIDELKQHPYFKNIATPVVNYRIQHNGFKTLEDLLNIDIISTDLYKKIVPYTEL